MHNVMSCLAAGSVPAAVDPVDLTIVSVSVLCGVFLSIWIAVYSGPFALRGCPARKNRMPAYIPLVYLVVWQVLALAAMTTIRHVLAGRDPTTLEFANYAANTCINIVMIAAALVLVRHTFAGRLKGFGLSPGTVGRDFAAAVINFVAILPLVWLGVVVVELAGRSIVGPGFEIGANEGLEALSEHSHPAMRLLILVYLVIAVPVFEEVHWPAILMLSVGMGYAYERSGSLFRPIFIHIFFNTTTVCAVLLSR